MIQSSSSSSVTPSLNGRSGGLSMLFEGRYDSSALTRSTACASSFATRCTLPAIAACAPAPPSSSSLITSPVAALITSGPAMNMCAVRSTMTMKSVSAGEYAAPPAHGPATTEICGATPESSTLW